MRSGNHYGEVALQSAGQCIRDAQPGSRNSTLSREAFSIGRLVGGGYIDEALAEAELREAGSSLVGDGLTQREVEYTVRRSLAKGIDSPKRLDERTRPIAGAPHSPRSPRVITFRPPKNYPPQDQVEQLWDAASSILVVPDALSWLMRPPMVGGRGFRRATVNRIADTDLARALPPGIALPDWARSRWGSWLESKHLVIVPLYDECGVFRSLRARRVIAHTKSPKTLATSSFTCSGLVFADHFARQVIESGKAPEWMADRTLEILIAEGDPDYLVRASRWAENEHSPAVIGIFSGSWSPELAARVPTAARVFIETHDDETGDKFAKEIHASLADRCDVFRVQPHTENES